MKVVAIVQARMGSQRLPNKVMRDIGGRPLIGLVLARLSRAKRLDAIVLATSTDPRNRPLVAHVESLGFPTHAGSENDVLDRYYQAAKAAGADVVVRVTGDCPLIDPDLVDRVVADFLEGGADYVSNVEPPTFPDGLDTEVFSFAALEEAWKHATETAEREHVTPWLRNNPQLVRRNVANNVDLSAERWTVDDPADLDVVTPIVAHFAPRIDFSWREVLALGETHPEKFGANRHLTRNEGMVMGSGQKLWQRAKRVIPGGNMLLSKRAEMFLPEQWPAYYSKSKGCAVWDLDGNRLIDMSMMGVGTNTLGYANDEVDDAVRAVVDAGNLTTLNAPEEVYLAEKLVEMHPWSDMVRFCRTGGEANSVAIRIARAASGKDKVAFCGYHGWHDWYLAANLGNNRTLAGHLLPGLDPNGVPQELNGSIIPFNYNNFKEFDDAVSDPQVGVVFMEVTRNAGPAEGFLEHIRKVTAERGMVLVFDECTSGFRESFGGVHLNYGVEPDMASFGKTLGNGYAITAVIGRRPVMEAAQTTFISSSFWTERIGPAAALKTLEVMERERSWETITATGKTIRAGWQRLADEAGIGIDHWGQDALCGFTIRSDHAQAYKTLVTQEMLAKGYLAGNSVYSSTAHTPDIVDRFFEELAPVFRLIRECEDGRDVMALLKGPVAHSGFKRLN
jgi:glutamate-1-semialdehyde 2,1-aminomutase